MSILYFGADGMYTIAGGLVSEKTPIVPPEEYSAENHRTVEPPARSGALSVQFGHGYGQEYDCPTSPDDVRIVVRVPPRKGRW